MEALVVLRARITRPLGRHRRLTHLQEVPPMNSGSLPRRRATLGLAGLIALGSMIAVLAAVATRESHAAGGHAPAPVATLTPTAVRA